MTSAKIVHITTVHPALDVRIFQKECRTLAQSGYHVTLLVANSNPRVVDGVTIVGISIPRLRLNRMTFGMFFAFYYAIRRNAVLYHLSLIHI